MFYLVPAIFWSSWGDIENGGGLLLMSATVIACYFIFWRFKVDVLIFSPLVDFFRRLGVFVVDKKAIYYIAMSYVFLMMYVALTAPAIPLFDAFKSGCGIDCLAQGREEFLRTRDGWEVCLNYMYSMYRSFLAPLVVCYLYATKDKFRHIFLIAFAVTLLLTLEKSVAVFSFAPLVCLFFGKKRYSHATFVVCLMLLSIAGTAFLARGGLVGVGDVGVHQIGADSGSNVSRLDVKPVAEVSQSMSAVPANYNKFNYGGQIGYVANRVFYIPYITAIDWLRYHREVLHGEYLHGKSISLVALILGEDRVRLDRDVFSFQWGQNSTGTGVANTVFFVDSYVNFGWIGCLLYTLIVVFIVRMVVISDVVGIQAAMVVPMLYLVFNSLTAMIFSGGIFFAVLLAIFSRGAGRKGGVGFS